MTANSAGWGRTFGRLLRLLDALLISVAGAIGFVVSGLSFDSSISGGDFIERVSPTHGFGVLLALALWSLLLEITGSRRPELFAKGPEEYGAVVNATGLLFLVLASVAFLVRAEPSRLLVGVFLASGLFLLLFGRIAARRFIWAMRSRGRMLTTVFLIGTASSNRRFLTREAPRLDGYRVVGAHAMGRTLLRTSLEISTLVNAVADSMSSPDVVVLTQPDLVKPTLLDELVARLEVVPVAFAVTADAPGLANARLQFRTMAGAALLGVRDIQLGSVARAGKRVFDLIVSLFALAVLWPLMLVIGVLVALDSPGGAFFRQARVGQFGKIFSIYKFRSMEVGAEDKRRELEDKERDAGNGVLFKLTDDPRVTRVGRIIRRWSLDELPQLINVAKGDMSLVGPRPPLPEEVRDYEGPVYRRLAAKPGLTGLWQVSGRSELSWEDSVRLDLQYVENWSFLDDIFILLKTVPTVLSRRGAH